MRAKADRTLAEVRAEALRSMTAVVPDLVEQVGKIAADTSASPRERVRAFEAVAAKVFPATGPDHVLSHIHAQAIGDENRAEAEREAERRAEMLSLVREPRTWLEQQITAALVENGDYSEDQARRLVEFWYAAHAPDDIAALIAAIVEEACATVMHPDEPPPEIEAGEVDDDDVPDNVSPLPEPSTNGHGADVSEMLDRLAARGKSVADVLDVLRDLDEAEARDAEGDE